MRNWPRAIQKSIRAILFLVVLAGILLSCFRPWACAFAATKEEQEKAGTTARKTAESSSEGYVGSAPCASCHQGIYRSFTRTDMGRSMTRVTPEVIQTLSLPGTFSSTTLNRRFEVFSKQGKLYQSEWQAGADGQDVFRSTYEIGWVIGSGANGFGGLLQRSSYLFEAPLSFYTQPKQWKLSPGYESVDVGFNRPVLPDCIFCHSGRPRPVEDNAGKFEEPPFSQLAIGCENCHGPGAAHLAAMRSHRSNLKSTQIVNPGNLNADLQNNICMSCHAGGDSRIPKPGKTYLDFRPGAPLDDALSIMTIPVKRENPIDTDHVNHYFQMSMSRCFLASSGQLRCTTCHDPHIQPTHEEAPAYFNAKCMTCHTNQSCTVPVADRHGTKPADNCIACHMPQRGMREIAHSSLTNHRILARPDEPLPEAAYEQTTTELPDLVHLDRVPGRPDDLPAVSLMKAYKQIAAHDPAYRSSYLKTLAELEQSDPNDAEVQLNLGLRDLRGKQFEKAAEHLRRSIDLNPQAAMTYAYLSEALRQNNRIDEAIAAIEKAASLEPYDKPLQRALVGTLVAAKQYERAKAAAGRYLEAFPEDPAIREVIANIESHR